MHLSKADYADCTPCPTCLRLKPRKNFVCGRCYAEMPDGWKREVRFFWRIVDPDARIRKAVALVEEARLVIAAAHNRLRFPSEV